MDILIIVFVTKYNVRPTATPSIPGFDWWGGGGGGVEEFYYQNGHYNHFHCIFIKLHFPIIIANREVIYIYNIMYFSGIFQPFLKEN